MTLINHRCFWITPTDRARYSLRRYKHRYGANDCPGPYGYHNAETQLGIGPEMTSVDEEGRVFSASPSVQEYLIDYRWPKQCSCGYVFQPDDEWQVNTHQLFSSGTPLGDMTMYEAPAGAMFEADWVRKNSNWTGSDGKCLAVKLPPGGAHDIWLIDGPSSSGGKWTRVGSVLPDISVTPSILTDKYHGFLTNGVLIQV